MGSIQISLPFSPLHRIIKIIIFRFLVFVTTTAAGFYKTKGGGGGGGEKEAKDQLKHLVGQLFMLEIYVDHGGVGGGDLAQR